MDISKVSYWCTQVIPPLLLVFIFSTHGQGFWFLLGIPVLCLFVSTVTIGIKLFNLKKNKRYFVRPVLTIFISGLLIVIANISYNMAISEAIQIRNNIKSQCENDGICPNSIEGWEEASNFGHFKTKVGPFITYPLFYTYQENTFSLYLYQSLDMGDTFSGDMN